MEGKKHIIDQFIPIDYKKWLKIQLSQRKLDKGDSLSE